MKDIKAIVFDIQRFSIHDGPGIRTTVFLKGCPLDCLWCHNPESKSRRAELMLNEQSCVGCRACVSACERGVHSFSEQGHMINRTACIGCGACETACVGAIKLLGKEYSVDEILSEVMKDASFYKNSGGGITVSGGEPLMQPEFTIELLKAAKSKGISTAVETSGYGSAESLARLAEYCDFFLFDCKETSPELHRKYTGKDNALILDNLKLLCDLGSKIVLRCPIIPTYNDRDEHFVGIAELANRFDGVIRVELEPYHSLGSSKANSIGKTYPLSGVASMTKDEAKPIMERISSLTSKEVKIS